MASRTCAAEVCFRCECEESVEPRHQATLITDVADEVGRGCDLAMFQMEHGWSMI